MDIYPTELENGNHIDIILEPTTGRRGEVLGLHCTYRFKGQTRIHSVGKARVEGSYTATLAGYDLIARAVRRASEIDPQAAPEPLQRSDWK